MSGSNQKSDTITIVIQGSRRVRQEVVDRIYDVIMEDGLLDDIPQSSNKDSHLSFSSTLPATTQEL